MRKPHSEVERDAAKMGIAIIGFTLVTALIGLFLAGWIVFQSLGGK